MRRNQKHKKLESKLQPQGFQTAPLKLSEMKTLEQQQLIDSHTENLLVEPEKNISSVSTLLTLTKSSNVKTCIFAINSLSTVFTSVSPLESVNVEDHKNRMSNQIKRDQYQELNFELKLVQGYKKYLDVLKELGAKLKPELFEDREIFVDFKRGVVNSLIKCAKVLWNFNYNKELLQTLMRYIKSGSVQETLRSMLADPNPTLLRFKSQIIKAITALILRKDERALPSNLVIIVNSVDIDSRYLKKTEETEKYKSKLKKRKEYREKDLEKKKNKDKDPLQLKQEMKQKRKDEKNKVKKIVEKDFAEGEQNINKKQMVKQNADILQQLFYLYFKLLTRRSYSVYMKHSLDGVLKFCHLVSTDLLQSLISHLDQSAQIFIKQWEQTKNTKFIEAAMYVIFTSESVINGPASVFNMLDIKEVCSFYKLLKNINKQAKLKWTKEMFVMTLKITQEMFIKKRQLSNEVIGSFLREILILCVQHTVPKFAFLETVRQLAFKYHKVQKMFEDDNEGYGINSFNSHIDDPQSTNAVYTSVLQFLADLQKKTTGKNEQSVIKALLKNSFQSDIPRDLSSIIQKEGQAFKQ